jgi:hypothetical protein
MFHLAIHQLPTQVSLSPQLSTKLDCMTNITDSRLSHHTFYRNIKSPVTLRTRSTYQRSRFNRNHCNERGI